MDREIDALLNSLLQEKERKPLHTEPPASEEALRRAEEIGQHVDNAYEPPAEPPKREIPAPRHTPVVVPPPVSHFTDEPSPDTAVRMRDKLEEATLPKPDPDRRPSQIHAARKDQPKHRRKPRAVPIVPEQSRPRSAETVPPVVRRQSAVAVDTKREEQVRSRAELIREQMRRRAEEEAAQEIAAPVLPEEPEQTVPAEPEPETAKKGFFHFLRKSEEPEIEEAAPEERLPEEPPVPPEQKTAPRLRHLAEPAEPPRKPSLFGRFRQRKQRTSEDTEQEDTGADPAETFPEDDIAETVPPEAYGGQYFREEPEMVETPAQPEEPEPPAPQEESQLPPLPQPEKKFRSVWQEALDETADELAEIRAEPMPEPDETPRTHFLKRNTYFIAGLVCFGLAVVGLVTLVRAGIGWTRGFIGGNSLREEIEDALYPAVVVDLPAFEEAAELPADNALAAAMMDILMHDDLSGYTVDFGMLTIPEADVTARAEKMFGVSYTPEGMLYAAGETFYYDSENSCYNVTDSPVIFSYAPEAEEIRRSGDIYTVTVHYRSDTAQWQEHAGNFGTDNEKTMQATLQKDGDGYRITRLVNAAQ